MTLKNMLRIVLRTIGMILLIIVISLVLFVGWMWIKPLGLEKLQSNPHPATSYDEALTQFIALQSLDTSVIDPVCHSQLMTHGSKTPKVIVFLHGYTNCPQQFVPLSKLFFDAGYNVLIPRMPTMGLADKLAPEQADLTGEELVKWTDAAIDIAQGLGDEITVVGISGGATLTGWTAQYRNIKRAVLIAPLFGIKDVPAWLTRPFVGLLLTAPNRFDWWDSERKEHPVGPVYGYPRYGSRPSGEILRVGFAVEATAEKSKPTAESILFITNAADRAVNKDRINTIMGDWGKFIKPESYEFDASLKLNHDIIDPNQVEQQVDVVYPILFKLITGTEVNQ